MGVFLDIALSILVGSMVLLMILTFNNDMIENNNINGMYGAVQKTGMDLNDILKYDLVRIGLLVPESTVKFIIADSNEIKFKSDFDLDGNVNEIHYYVGDLSSAGSSENPNDKILYRKIDDDPVEDYSLGLISLSFTYYDDDGNETSTLNEIRQIEYSFYLESTFVFNEQYPGIYMRGRIKPKNLE